VGTERRKSRVTAAAISGAAGIAAFVALGGAGLAQTAIAPAQSQTSAPDQSQAGKKVVICHKLKNTISVSVNAWPAHQRHGDTEGACAAVAPTQATTEPTKQKKPKKSKQGSDTTPTTSDQEANESDDTTSGRTSETRKQHKQHKQHPGNAGATGTSHGDSGKPKKPKHANGLSKHGPAPGGPPLSGGHGNGKGNGK
jgi:hypothetical protein